MKINPLFINIILQTQDKPTRHNGPVVICRTIRRPQIHFGPKIVVSADQGQLRITEEGDDDDDVAAGNFSGLGVLQRSALALKESFKREFLNLKGLWINIR